VLCAVATPGYTWQHDSRNLCGHRVGEIARCNDGDGEDEEYRAACLLAQGCGVNLKDGSSA